MISKAKHIRCLPLATMADFGRQWQTVVNRGRNWKCPSLDDKG